MISPRYTDDTGDYTGDVLDDIAGIADTLASYDASAEWREYLANSYLDSGDRLTGAGEPSAREIDAIDELDY